MKVPPWVYEKRDPNVDKYAMHRHHRKVCIHEMRRYLAAGGSAEGPLMKEMLRMLRADSAKVRAQKAKDREIARRHSR